MGLRPEGMVMPYEDPRDSTRKDDDDEKQKAHEQPSDAENKTSEDSDTGHKYTDWASI